MGKNLRSQGLFPIVSIVVRVVNKSNDTLEGDSLTSIKEHVAVRRMKKKDERTMHRIDFTRRMTTPTENLKTEEEGCGMNMMSQTMKTKMLMRHKNQKKNKDNNFILYLFVYDMNLSFIIAFIIIIMQS